MQLPRFCLISTILLFLTTHAFAHTGAKPDTPLSTKKIFPVSGFLAASCNGLLMEAREYVCQSNIIVSDLRWPLVPSFSYSLHGGIYLPKGIHIEGNVSFLQPMKTGTMIDKDFEDMTVLPLQPELTKRSEHACDIIGGIQWMAKLGVQIAMPQSTRMKQAGITVLVEPMISFYYSVIKWHSYNGYLQYAKIKPNGMYEPWSTALPKVPHNGPAVSYQQQVMIPAIGLGFETAFPYKLTLSSDFHLTAGIMAAAEDIHHDRNIRFVDTMGGGWAMHGNIRLQWKCLPFFAVFFNLFYQYCTATKGNSAVYNGITSTKPNFFTPPNSAGTSLRGCTFSLGCAFVLGR